MPTSKKKKSSPDGKQTLFTSAIDTLSLGVVLIIKDGDKQKIQFASNHLNQTLGIRAEDVVDQDASVFWDLLIARLGNPFPFREDLERIADNDREIRTDVLHLVKPGPLVLERSTAPTLDEAGNYLGRIWTFRNISREFKLREELQKKRKTEFCFRTLSSFLFEASMSPESLQEICRIACTGLDVASVAYVPLRPSDELELAQFSVSRRYQYTNEAEGISRYVAGAVKNLDLSAVSVVELADMDETAGALFSPRRVSRVMIAPVGFADDVYGAVLVEEVGRERQWLREDFRCVQSVASALGLWLQKEEHEGNLVRAREAAEAAARVRSDFIALLSHELRTPLNPLIGFTQLLEEQCEGMSQETQDMVARIADGAMRLRELVEDLLTLTRLDSRLDGWRKYHCDPRGIVEDCCSWVRRQAQDKEIEVVLEMEKSLGVVEADGAALRRAINALLSNAVRFSPKDGCVDVSATSTDDFFRVRIVDQGPGVADEAKKRIFEPFVQGEPVLTRRFGGAGIGLTLVRKVADAHDGRVWVEDGEDGGSVFTLEIPKAELPTD